MDGDLRKLPPTSFEEDTEGRLKTALKEPPVDAGDTSKLEGGKLGEKRLRMILSEVCTGDSEGHLRSLSEQAPLLRVDFVGVSAELDKKVEQTRRCSTQRQ